jgi:V8-like Glu-specific endopeptidase
MEIEDAHQRMVEAGVLTLDSAVWRARLGELEAQTCRVEVQLDQGGTSYGTGFLLGPSVLITNHHVLEPVYRGLEGKTTAKGYSAKPEKVTARFDYKRLPEGILNYGVTYALAADWDLDRSDTHRPIDSDAPADRLDYGLIRLAEKAGSQKAGKKKATTGNERGWMTPFATNAIPINSPLFVLQHPKGDPLKLGMSTNGVISVTGGGTRLRHRVNTEAGSSGSPCFNQKLELVALHHAGDPDFDKPANWNQAIPFAAILELLEQRGKKPLLGT